MRARRLEQSILHAYSALEDGFQVSALDRQEDLVHRENRRPAYQWKHAGSPRAGTEPPKCVVGCGRVCRTRGSCVMQVSWSVEAAIDSLSVARADAGIRHGG